METAQHAPSGAQETWSEGEATLALAPYDRHAPIFDGSVTIEGVRPLEVGQSGPGRHGSRRHERMIRHAEFDGAECSLSSYLMAQDKGIPLTAIPVFPRRLFSVSQMWCRADSAMTSPGELRGKRVGINTFQTTLSVLAKGDLKRSYGVDWRHLTWVVGRKETVAFAPPDGASIERAPEGRHLSDLLRDGAIDALVLPHPPGDLLDSGTFRRLSTDPQSEEERYFREFGYFPIMHVIAFRDEVLERRPALALEAFHAFNRAWEVCRSRYDDPNGSWLAWGRHALEHQRRLMGESDGWPNGIAANRKNLSWFVEQSLDQGLIGRRPEISELFHASTLDT